MPGLSPRDEWRREKMTEQNEMVVRKIQETYNRKDLDAMLEYYSDDVTVLMSWGDKVDKESLRKIMTDWIEVFPDGSERIERMLSIENTVVVEKHWKATHKGEIFGIPATHKEVKLYGAEIFDFESGLIKQQKLFWNFRNLEQQLRE